MSQFESLEHRGKVKAFVPAVRRIENPHQINFDNSINQKKEDIFGALPPFNTKATSEFYILRDDLSTQNIIENSGGLENIYFDCFQSVVCIAEKARRDGELAPKEALNIFVFKCAEDFFVARVYMKDNKELVFYVGKSNFDLPHYKESSTQIFVHLKK